MKCSSERGREQGAAEALARSSVWFSQMTPSSSKGLSALSREGRGVIWRLQQGARMRLPTCSRVVGWVSWVAAPAPLRDHQ